ncbi:hypothetical protein ACO1Y9_27410 [Klebsiella quasipneumoniae]|uniref:hypothetical protein n=1 Tax=Klebsiella TaxID=570 RepID=UPI000808DF4A|nr:MULTISPECIES: hypothetical protein [Klebsiella]HBR1847306.1 hypothetical protein [Klebsiella quasipneumoniae subsp. quasipneumoniae]HBW1516592.1 hypothetical protein [Klebsiella quasipneumoniae subsp. similipneumoniae]EIY5093430.1 hypothetical protein [Klebsiella quasipneumoniae]MBX4664462.1 hypothetical protein [Klebsiella pneumoniae]MCE0168745.1 hypothetical protein [Klebsiella pneumoniae]
MLMSKAEYARHRGVSRQTVYDWVAKGEVVLSGNKIDVEATARSLQKEQKKPNECAPRVLRMTWGQCWAAVKALDGKKTRPYSNEEVERRVLRAANELNWEVEFLEDGGIYMCDGDTEFYLTQYDLIQNADIAIGLLRRDICYGASESPDDEDEWSEEGVEALAEWAR